MLAWERTGLSVMGAAAGVSRHAFGQLGFAFLLPCAVAAVGGLWIYVSALRRGRLTHSPASDPVFTVVLRDGRLQAVVAALMGALCLGEAAGAVLPLLR